MAKGKLYLCGEYAVVDGGAAVIASVNRQMRARVVRGDAGAGAGAGVVEIVRVNVDVRSVPELRANDPNRFVLAAAWVAAQFVVEAGGSVFERVTLRLESELREADGRKYGLGSSGAVTVAVLEALLAGYDVSAEHIYKLAVLALHLVGDNGSAGDIACCAFGQLLYYVRPDVAFVRELGAQMLTMNVHEAVACAWPGLVLEPLQWLEGVSSAVGWTGSPASSADLVDSVRAYKKNNTAEYAQFVRESTRIAQAMREACVRNNTHDFEVAYAQASENMARFSAKTGGYMFTPALHTCVEIAQQYGWVAKFSGAGGGDCAIAVSAQNLDKNALHAAWDAAGIMAMNWQLG
ncbi:phosphomevalonate kinase [Alloscardovia sp. HMSC034E08]|uniref:phosphomevalonate kinase n=1 Tax=Alloscardovia sp. HMSC034E08 TaxID=1739413 RepID=UPI0008B71739|nr:phosphomevalonate kinase [Alloscardovia sp. HMSC034E08]OFQ99341.1 hypothetical protein HMPREF2909_07215 [Alloscardovia sp. HMSC034E08]